MSGRRKAARQSRPEIEWDFNSFPTLYGFAAGVFLATLLIQFGLFAPVFLVSLFGFSFCSAHAISRFVVRNRRRRVEGRAEEEERERRALAARAAAQAEAEAAQPRRRRRRR